MLAAMSDAQPRPSGELARTALQLLALGALLVTSLWIVRPFLIAGVWASMIAVATWPLLLRAQALLAGRRGLATALLTLLLLLILVIPLYLGISAVVESAEDIASLSQTLASWSLPQPPDWLERVPLLGAKAASQWRELAAEGPEELAARVTPYARDIAKWLVAEIGNIGMVVVQFILTVIFTAILYSTGETAARGVRAFFRRLDGDRGDQVVLLAGASIRAVALGIVVTALVQTVLGALGLLVSGVPYVTVLAALMFICCIVQIGPTIVLLGGIGWLWYTDAHTWAIVLGIWTVFVGTLDNFLRPLLIKRGADLPFLLILAGVLGGLLTLGIVGLFIGPVVLAIAYRLIEAWVGEGEPPKRGA